MRFHKALCFVLWGKNGRKYYIKSKEIRSFRYSKFNIKVIWKRKHFGKELVR